MKPIDLLLEEKAYTIRYNLDRAERHRLLTLFRPRYRRVVAHHITISVHATKDDPIPAMPESCFLVGYRNDNRGIEIYVAEVNGGITRPDGGIYHITWSLDDTLGYTPVYSNRVLGDLGFDKINAVRIRVTPKKF